MSQSRDKLKQVKVSSMDRRLSLARASLVAGTRWATANASTMFSSKDQKDSVRRQALTDQAQYLADEIGKLKGSIVKIGQMMALYGEHFLAPEITTALNTLNSQTVAVEWETIQKHLRRQLGDRLDLLEVEPEPIGTASLAQVHRATRKSDGLVLVLKIQYPDVASAIDSDMELFRQLTKITQVVPQTREFEQWFEEVREMMHREVDYALEADTTRRFYQYLKDDARYAVPQIVDEFCSEQVLCMTYESGVPINSASVLALPQQRRNAIAEASIEIALREIFEWNEMQTDPNFGNYLIRIGDGAAEPDRLVLLDFGAMRQFDESLINVARNLISAGYHHDIERMINAMQGYSYFDQMNDKIKQDMAKVFLTATEAISPVEKNPELKNYLNLENKYLWKKSQLHQRVMDASTHGMISKDFSMPPKEFMFISRKFIGSYTFLTVIDAQTDLRKIAAPFIVKD